MLLLVGGIAAIVIAVFAIAGALGLELAASSSAVACALLVADVVLPVPSSLLLAWLGAEHGVVAGAALGAAAHTAGGALGFALGRLAERPIGRWIGEAERARVDRLIARWGIAGVAASRPVPVLAETVAIAAGLSRGLGGGRFVLAAAAGSLPYAAINAAAGAEAREGDVGVALGAAVVIAIAAAIFSRPRGRASE